MERNVKKGEVLETGVKDAPVKDIRWDVNEIETEAVRINDPGVGEGRVLRHFFFKANPVDKDHRRATKADIINSYKKLIEMSLWSDGLVPSVDQPLELHTRRSVKSISKTLYLALVANHADFVIQVLAEPKQGLVNRAFFRQTPTTI